MSTASATTGHRIVVGADGSESSGAALSWAVRQAGLTGATGGLTGLTGLTGATGGLPGLTGATGAAAVTESARVWVVLP